MKISLGEQKILECGLYVSCPINLQIMLKQNELYVLNCIRHSNNISHKRISNSALRIMTGLNEKTIRKARQSLVELGLLEVCSVTSAGTEYRIKYSKLCKHLAELNSERNPVGRLILADNFRGDEKKIHQNTINAFIESEFNKKIL